MSQSYLAQRHLSTAMPFGFSGVFDIDEWDSVASILSDGVPEANPDSLYTESRGPTVVLRDGSGGFVADGPEGTIEESNDGGVVIQSILDNFSGGVEIAVKSLIDLETTPTIDGDDPNVVFDPDGRRSGFRSTSAMTEMFDIKAVRRGPTFHPMEIDGGDNADRFLKTDAVSHLTVDTCIGYNFNTRFIYNTSSAQQHFSDHWMIRNNWVYQTPKFVKSEPGTDGHATDHWYLGNHIASSEVTGWAYEFIDCSRLNFIGNYAGNNSNQWTGGLVKLVSDGSYGGSPPSVESNRIVRPYVENVGYSGVTCVKFDTVTSNGTQLQNNLASWMSLNAGSGTSFEAANTGGARMNRANTVWQFGTNPENVTIGADCYAIDLWHGGEPGSLRSNTTDNGDFTRINGEAIESANAETPDTSRYPTGTWVDFTDSGDGSGTGFYYIDRSGTAQGPL